MNAPCHRIYLIWSILFLGLQSVSGQKTFRALVFDQEKVPIAIGNIVFIAMPDSNLLAGSIFYDGQISIELPSSRETIYAKISSLGFSDHSILIEPVFDSSVKHEIVLSAKLMNGVEVVASREMITHRGSDVIVQVANTALGNAGTAMDVVQNAPKISSDRSGQFSVLGKGAAFIYLDGQQIASTQVLSSISSTDIQQIEIIENPGANFDAAGNAVINIITKKKTLEGYKIGLLQEVGKGKHFRSYFQSTGYYKLKKVMFQGSYGIRPWTWGGRNQQTRSHQSEVLTTLDNKFSQINRRLDHDFSFKTNYAINDRHTAGLSYVGSLRNGDKEALNRRDAFENNVETFQIISNLNGPYEQRSNTLNLFYKVALDSIGSEITASSQFSNFTFDRKETIDQDLISQEDAHPINRRSANANQIEISTAQLDYTKNLASGLQFSAGLKRAEIANASAITFETRMGSQYEIIPAFSNRYQYRENITAAYFQMNGQFKKTAWEIGLRQEWTDTEGRSSSEDGQQELTKKYQNLFPSLSITQKWTEEMKATVGFNHRINRPLFQDLNPYVLYVDSLLYLRGNPNLEPEYTSALSATLQYKSWNFSLGYTHIKNKVNQVFRSEDVHNPNVIAFIKENLNSVELYSASAAHPIQTKWLSGYITVGGFFDDHRLNDFDGREISNTRFGWFLQANPSIPLPWDLKLDAVINYTSPRIDGPYYDNSVSFVHIALSRKFFKNKLTVRLWGNDVFDKFKFTGFTRFNNMDATYLSEGDWHYAKLVLQWDFGRLGIGRLQENQISKSELMRINTNQN